MPKTSRSPLECVLRFATDGPTVRPELGPCLDFRKPITPTFRYPTTKLNGKNIRGNRVVLEAALGRPIRDGYCALHHCDRTGCLRASHIYEGTMKDNALDRDCRKGNPFKKYRFPGELAPNAKLSNEIVRRIRALASLGHRNRDIQKAAGLSAGHVDLVVKRAIWAHV